ncbi:TonB-dependent receptor [Bacteroidales bacterium OttesenSCG-928-M11]|nr:TonB-dependent receptor [Bacteroidales bacterium OttesenSCG-928-M11]
MKSRFLLLLLICCSSIWTKAEDVTISTLDSIQYLNEIVVTANKFKDVIPSQSLSGESLERINSLSVADAVRYFSGIQVKDYGGIGGLKTIDVRSMGSNHTAVFYDGIQIGNMQSGQVDLGKFSLDNIEEIVLYNGQKSNIFQPAKDFGASGTVYLQTNRPRFQKGKSYNLKGTFRIGSFSCINPSLLYEQKLTEDINLSANIEYLNASGEYKFRYRRVQNGVIKQDTTATRKNGDVESLRMEGNLHGWLDKGKWNVKAYYYNSERGIPGAIVGDKWDNQYQRQWDENFFVQGNYQKELFSGYELMINAKYANDYLKYNPDTSFRKSQINTFSQEELYVSLANKYSINPHWKVSLSADYQKNKLDSTVNMNQPERDMFLLSLATSYEKKDLRAMASLLMTHVEDNIQWNQNAFNKTVYTPGIFLYYDFPKTNLSLRAFYKKSFRMPSFNDLYYTDVVSQDLKPEYATQYNVGAQWDFLRNKADWQGNISIDAYYNRVKDKIVAIPNNSSLARWTMENLGKVKIKGIDISSKLTYRCPLDIIWDLHLQYTYQEARDYSTPEDKGVDGGTWGGQIPYIPWHSGSTILSAQYKSWNLAYSFIYVGERYNNSANIVDNHRQPWYTSDISLSKNFKYQHFDFKLTGEVNNLLDQQYEVIRNYPMPGRNYRLTLRISL